jgi:hypothetical protein
MAEGLIISAREPIRLTVACRRPSQPSGTGPVEWVIGREDARLAPNLVGHFHDARELSLN